jgi:SAM-dependent methyltransferase
VFVWPTGLISLVWGPWSNWPARAYLRSSYRLRLGEVQAHLSRCLDEAAPGPVYIVSLCAGDGRDVTGTLEAHPRRSDVEAWLVERDWKSVEAGIQSAAGKELRDHVHFILGDATNYATYANLSVCDIVVFCGVLGHVMPCEKAETVKRVAQFCKPGGAIVWTRGLKRGKSRVSDVERLFDQALCEKVRSSVTADGKWGIVTHRYMGPAVERPKCGRIFNFRRVAER